ncbi:MAG: TIM barrel protein [Novosphingobium sp.]
MSRLGIEGVSVLGLPPVRFIELAAQLGAPNISLGPKPMDYNPHGYPRYSLFEDAALRREIKAALAANGVAVSLGENLAVMAGDEGTDAWQASLDLMSEFGVTRFNSVSFESDLARNVDRYGMLTELAASYGVRVLIEFVPIFPLADLPTALEIIRRVGRPELGWIADTMHLARTGVAPEALREIPPDSIGYIQLCDVPLESSLAYMDEAMHERMAPGDGEAPLAAYLAALPQDRIVSLEIPQRSRAEAGVAIGEALADCVAKARDLLAIVDAERG